MELVRRTIRMTRQKGKAVSQMTLDDDYNIPETMPDVYRRKAIWRSGKSG